MVALVEQMLTLHQQLAAAQTAADREMKKIRGANRLEGLTLTIL